MDFEEREQDFQEMDEPVQQTIKIENEINTRAKMQV